MTVVAIIGGGVAGMGAACALRRAGLDVVILEAARRLGGNCVGIPVRDAEGRVHTVDVGVSDFNRTTFTAVSALIDGLGLPTHPISSDTDFVSPDGRSRAHCRDGAWRFESAVADPLALAAEIAAFRERAAEVLVDSRVADWSTSRYLDHIGASEAFRTLHLYPRAIGCFPMPDCVPQDIPILELVAFWNVHGLVGAAPARRHCVIGGMHRYAAAFARDLAERGVAVHCGTRVVGVVRRAQRVEVRTVDCRDRHRRMAVDHVVIAGHAHDALALLEDPSPDERDVLSRFAYQRARAVVHQDERLMGHDRDAWGAFNYVVPEGRLPRVRPTITFFPNRLARLPAEVPEVFVSMNPPREPRPDRVLVDRFFLHPLAGASTRAAIRQSGRIQGRRRTWFAGGYLRVPFVHESALLSGLHCAEHLLEAEAGTAARTRARTAVIV
ncbi:MAG: FAD-dependent oxidoreductase [Planctomycetes bacterium]|nr:FAD-dependent oxidoreductase [Planctomycetota bacterium]